MYHKVVRQYAQALRNIHTWLDKAQQHADAKKFNVQVLMTARLAPDMAHFTYQIQSACDYAKGAAALLSGQKAPRHEDTEQTVDELRSRIDKTVAFIESVKEGEFAEAAERKVPVSWSPPGKLIRGEEYSTQVSIPNVYFHLMAAYAILRHNGVALDKMEYLGPIDWVDAQS